MLEESAQEMLPGVISQLSGQAWPRLHWWGSARSALTHPPHSKPITSQPVFIHNTFPTISPITPDICHPWAIKAKKQAFGPHWSPSFSISGHFRLIWTDKGLLACACLCCVARAQVTTRNLCMSTISTARASPLRHLPALFTTIQSVSAPKCALLYWVSSAQCPQSVPPLYWVSGGQCQQPPTSSFAAINQRPRATPNSFWPLLLLNKFGNFWMSIHLELGHTVLRSEQDCSGKFPLQWSMNRFNICIWGNKLTDTNRNLFDDPKQKSLEIAIVPNIQNAQTQSYCNINYNQILKNLVPNKLNTIFSCFRPPKRVMPFPAMSPQDAMLR